LKPEGSLPRLQKPATGPYSEPSESSPDTKTIRFKIHFHIIIPSVPISPKLSTYFEFPTKISYEFLSIPMRGI